METIDIKKIVKDALKEDIGRGDITSEFSVADNASASFELLAKENMILCGREFFEAAFKEMDPAVKVKFFFKDGDKVNTSDVIAKGSGNARNLLAAERVALNLMQYLSGIATKTSKFVEKIASSKAQILDTRKILPFYREAAKYAVVIGGGENHRMRLDDQILIKDNHIAAAGSIEKVLEKCHNSTVKVEIECETLEQVREALKYGPDIIMLDNMNISLLKKSIQLIDSQVKIEVSGNVNLENIANIAALDVDYISVGELTHSVQASDISLRLKIA